MGLEGLAVVLAPRIGAHTPPVFHAAHVGFASAAAIAALLLPDTPARCDAPPPRGGWYAGVPEPFPTAAFEGDLVDRSFILDKEMRPSGTVVTSIADGPRGISYVKTYPSEFKGILSTFYPFNVLLSAIRSIAITAGPVAQGYMEQVDELEEEAYKRGDDRPDWPALPRADLFAAGTRSLWMTARDLATMTVRRLYEFIASRLCSPRTTWKLLKDVRKSAVRKAVLPWHARTWRISRTAFRANLLGSAADCTVTIAIDTYRAVGRANALRMYKGLHWRLSRIVVANVIRCSTCLAVASIGTAVGAVAFGWTSRPGTAGVVVGMLAELGFGIFVMSPLVQFPPLAPHMLFEWAYYDEPTFVVAPPPEAALGGAPDSDGDGNGGDQLGADEPRYRPVY